jgi:hypothetical protein
VSTGFSQLRKTYFAIGLFTGAQSQMVTYAFITTVNGEFTGVQVVRKDRFIYSAFGYWPHPANPTKENLFEKHQIDSCFLVENDFKKVVGYYTKPFEDLWKIRFYEHPYEYDSPGWSQGQYKPSQGQMAFLTKEYGIKNILTEYIYGDSLFKLLRDMQNSSWVVSYKTASIDTTSTP